MKKFALISALLISFFSFSQSQVLNGISLNGPNGFTKSGDLTWTKGNDIITVASIGTDKISYEGFEMQCQKGSRASEFYGFENFEISGNEYPLCFQIGDNGMLMGQTFIYRDGHTYILVVGTYTGDYDSSSYKEMMAKSMEQLGYMFGYMIPRVTTY